MCAHSPPCVWMHAAAGLNRRSCLLASPRAHFWCACRRASGATPCPSWTKIASRCVCVGGCKCVRVRMCVCVSNAHCRLVRNVFIELFLAVVVVLCGVSIFAIVYSFLLIVTVSLLWTFVPGGGGWTAFSHRRHCWEVRRVWHPIPAPPRPQHACQIPPYVLVHRGRVLYTFATVALWVGGWLPMRAPRPRGWGGGCNA